MQETLVGTINDSWLSVHGGGRGLHLLIDQWDVIWMENTGTGDSYGLYTESI